MRERGSKNDIIDLCDIQLLCNDVVPKETCKQITYQVFCPPKEHSFEEEVVDLLGLLPGSAETPVMQVWRTVNYLDQD